MQDKKAVELVKRYDDLKAKRAQHESLWSDLDFFFKPMKKDHISGFQNVGERYSPTLYTSHGWRYADKCKNGFISNFINPSTSWFRTGKNSEIDNIPKDKLDWQDYATKVFYNVFENSNFYQEIDGLIYDWLTLGNGVITMFEDPKTSVIFQNKSITDIVFDEDYRRKPNIGFIKYKMSVHASYEKFKDIKITEKLQKLYDGSRFDDEIEYLEVITPRYGTDLTKKDILNMPYAKYTIEQETKEIIEEGGIEYFPFYLLRGKRIANDLHGYNIGASVLSDLRTLNDLIKSYAIITQMQYEPTWVLDRSIFNTPINLRPNGIIETNGNVQGNGNLRNQIFALTNPMVPNNILEIIEFLQNSIKDAFMVDMFTFLDNTIPPNTTATQIMIMNQKNMTNLSALAPMIIYDFLDPLFSDLFNLLIRTKELEPPPDTEYDNIGNIISMGDVKIDYVSPLVMSQKSGEAIAVQNYLSRVGEMAQVNPEVLDNINFDAIVQSGISTDAIPSKFLKSMDEVQQLRIDRAQIQQEQTELAKLQAGANIAKTGAEAERAMTKGTKQ